MRWKGLIPGLAVCLLLSGCLTTNELLNTAATTSTATVASLAGASTPVVALTTAGAGVITGVVTSEPVTVDEAITALPPEQQVQVLKNEQIWHSVEKLGWWAIVILGGVFAFFWLVPSPGDFFRRLSMNKKLKRYERKLFDDPSTKMSDVE